MRGLLRGAAVSGLVTVLAAATLGGAGAANASCMSIGGFFSIGSGCTSSPLSFAVVLGNGTANARGLLTGAVAIGNATFADAQGFLTGAIANGLGNDAPGPVPPQTDVRSAGALSLAYGGGTNLLVRTQGNLNFAVGQGDNYLIRAGGTPADIGNVALSLGNHTPSEPGDLAATAAGNIAPNGPPSYFNLAVNLGNGKNVQSGGFLNSVLNIFGDGTTLAASGILNNATNIFGDDNAATAANVPDPAVNILRQIGGNVAFAIFGNGNTVHAGSQVAPPDGPLAIAGALGADDRSISQPGTGITIATPFNSTGGSASVLAARGTQGTLVRPSLNFTPGRNSTSNLRSTSPGGPIVKFNNQLAASVKKFDNQLAASAKKFNDQLAASAKKFDNQLAASIKKSSHNVNATRGAAKPDAASSTGGGSEK